MLNLFVDYVFFVYIGNMLKQKKREQDGAVRNNPLVFMARPAGMQRKQKNLRKKFHFKN